jgi:membrane fusion protein (multidrug efflux system)
MWSCVFNDRDARVAVERAKANLDNTVRKVRGRYARTAGLHARIDRTSISNHPDVLAADDQLHAAYLRLARTKLVASVSGFVQKRTVEVGQRVSPGLPLMAIVPLDVLDSRELVEHPLRIGLSMTVDVDTHERDAA